MTSRKRTVDKVRASRDGHEYHEAWTARLAMQLLWPDTELVGIAVEGISPSDQATAAPATTEIADITLYYGRHPTFQHATRTSIVQFKYSVAESSADFKASNGKQTIAKFAVAYRDLVNRYGSEAVHEKLDFQLVTNRPIYKPLLDAIESIAKRSPQSGNTARQARQFKAASGLDGTALAAFASKCKIIGPTNNLSATKHDLATVLVDWSATTDPIARARLGQLRQLVRDKAGHAGTNRNLITRTDILAAFEIGDPDDLLPCKPATVDVGPVVHREQLPEATGLALRLTAPLLIHAAGGVGKTVFMSSLASALRDSHETVLFDCFGGGAYRFPEDARHLPKRGLIHIANTLAFRGLCDPILPGAPDVESLFRTFRRRLAQSVATIRRTAPERGLALLIDAIDNAELFARERSESSFPRLLLESLHHEPIEGVKLIVSCRTERKPSTHARCHEFELRPFTISETTAYLRPRLTNVSQAEISVAQARSNGNPRVLDHLVKTDRSVLDQSEIHKPVQLDDLIQQRISAALDAAIGRGYNQEHIAAFLAGLAVLPPPVPVDEYASAHGMQLSQVESFVADLRPLLERTKQGIMFRDEPTETLVRNRYGSSEDALRRVSANLLARQDTSVYAARALPGLLYRLGDGEQLLNLAFDPRMPAHITGTVGRRNIRYARIKTAVLHAATKRDYNRLVRLLVELSTIAASDQRGTDYILDLPDLVAAARDIDAKRRLFEARTAWPGTRHARLAIAYCLSGEHDEAVRHAIMTDEWLGHYRRTYDERTIRRDTPERLDIAALPFLLICEGRPQRAVEFLKGWRDWYAYEVCEYVFDYVRLAEATQPAAPRHLASFTAQITDIGPLTAALSFQPFPRRTAKELVRRLSGICRKTQKLHLSESYYDKRAYQLPDGLRKASVLALFLSLKDEATAISSRAPHSRPGIWSLRDSFYHSDVFPFVFHTALIAAAKNRPIHEKDLLPSELVTICSVITRRHVGKAFRERVIALLANCVRKEPLPPGAARDPTTLSYDEKQEAERFLGQRLEPILALTRALSRFLAAPARRVDVAFLDLLKTWEDVAKNRNPYRDHEFDTLLSPLSLETALFALWARSELKSPSVTRFLETLHSHHPSAHTLIQVVSLLAQRPSLQGLAGEIAQRARTLIEEEHDVTHRASLFANLARAILPASIDDASVYFQAGLEQMDAIGSGDYEFTNELLLFASALKGDELDERDFHTLTNICELNIGEEPEKFFWGAFASGLSKAAGPRGLAKLSRWDDRSKIRLSGTLLPYLTALVDHGKIDPVIALALNRLANPVEYYQCGTEQFASALEARGCTARPELIDELIRQFQEDNPGTPSDDTVKMLTSLAEKTFGSSSPITAYLSEAHLRYAHVRHTTNEHLNYRGAADAHMRLRVNSRKNGNREALREIAASTNPADYASLVQAISALNKLEHIWDLKDSFFASLRSKVPFNARAHYVTSICELEHMDFYWKLAELKQCRDAWAVSSAVLPQALKSAAIPLTRLHADDLMAHRTLSGYKLRQISDLTAVSVLDLVLELVKLLAGPERPVPGAVWLAFASIVCPEADEGQGQIALRRLLASEAAQLADKVPDGPYAPDLYPESDADGIATGLIWRMLGSPHAEDRWRAAHSIRCLAKLERWNIVDGLVSRLTETKAGPFQAPELPFYYLHARLWLTVALARMARDYPREVARYRDQFLRITSDKANPHVLMRHFAAGALLACVEARSLAMLPEAIKELHEIDSSPYPRLNEKTRTVGDFYSSRPQSAPKPAFDFHLDYDFHKYEVDGLARVFGKSCWEVKDMMSAIVHRLDPNVSTMYESAGRYSPYRHTGRGLTTDFHTHGQQLAWHALFFAAGNLLPNFPVTNDYYYPDDPWGEWLQPYLLTRDDGLWLSDGTDKTPLDAAQILLEKGKDGLVLTGDRNKLLQLPGLTPRLSKELVVQGSWHSADGVRIRISSALVQPQDARRLARRLLREDPMLVFLPAGEQTDDTPALSRNHMKDYLPWIVRPSGETRLDEHDPYASPSANLRPRLSSKYISTLSLTTDEPFGRYWRDSRRTTHLRAEAWGRTNRNSDGEPYTGLRFWCTTQSLRRILKTHNKTLLLLISLERYEKEGPRTASKYFHTVAVASINKNLTIEYFKGRVNHLHQTKY